MTNYSKHTSKKPQKREPRKEPKEIPKKTLVEECKERIETIHDKRRAEVVRKVRERDIAQEEEVLRMVYGPDWKKNA
jgi:hypothetical protein